MVYLYDPEGSTKKNKIPTPHYSLSVTRCPWHFYSARGASHPQQESTPRVSAPTSSLESSAHAARARLGISPPRLGMPPGRASGVSVSGDISLLDVCLLCIGFRSEKQIFRIAFSQRSRRNVNRFIWKASPPDGHRSPACVMLKTNPGLCRRMKVRRDVERWERSAHCPRSSQVTASYY